MVRIWININERFVVLSMIAGNSSPYCVLTCGTQQSKTPIAQGKNSFYDPLLGLASEQGTVPSEQEHPLKPVTPVQGPLNPLQLSPFFRAV